MTLRVIDIETTGTDPMTDKVIEIASVDLAKGGVLVNERASLVDPGMPIPPQTSAVHHIIDADVAGAPAFRDAIEPFLGATVYVAHNAAFEESFLGPAGFGPWVCTYKCALRVWPDFPAHGNQALRYLLGHVEPFGRPRASIEPHRALSDVIVTAAILVELTKRARWSDLVAWSKEPPLMTRLGFGKHKGMRFDDVPEDYLRWIVETSDLDKGAKFSASMALARRTHPAPHDTDPPALADPGPPPQPTASPPPAGPSVVSPAAAPPSDPDDRDTVLADARRTIAQAGNASRLEEAIRLHMRTWRRTLDGPRQDILDDLIAKRRAALGSSRAPAPQRATA